MREKEEGWGPAGAGEADRGRAGQAEDARSSLTSEHGQGAIGQGHHAVRRLAAAQVLLVVIPLCKTQTAAFV